MACKCLEVELDGATGNPFDIKTLPGIRAELDAIESELEELQQAIEELEKLRSVRWMLDCGDDDGIIFTNLDFFIEMKREKVPVELRVRNGKHNWVFWRESLPEILAFSFK